MKRAVLLIAFHFPPYSGSSSVHRTVNFSRYLPEAGWRPLVLTVRPGAYPRSARDVAWTPLRDLLVRRAPVLDAARHLSLGGRYLRWTALPDRWASWCVSGIPSALRLIQEYEPRVIWSTFPVASAHVLGLVVSRLSGLPWIADFRDSMTEDEYPPDPVTRRVHRMIERATVRRCRAAVFTTPGARRMYAERYPDLPSDRWAVIENGFDELSMRRAEREFTPREAGGPVVLVHSGRLYRSERDPTALFEALGRLHGEGHVSSEHLRLVFLASGDEDYYRDLARRTGAEPLVEFAPPVPYVESLREVLRADGLLVMQASNCSHQVPAKVYEYIRAGRPVLALTNPEGDTATVLRGAGIETIVPLDSAARIAEALPAFLEAVRRGSAPVVERTLVDRYSRSHRTKELAALLDRCDSGRAAQ